MTQLTVEIQQILAGQSGELGCRAGRGGPVAMVLSIDRPEEGGIGQRGRIHPHLQEAGQEAGPQAVDVGLGEARTQDHVGHQIQSRFQARRGDLQTDHGPVKTAVGREVGSQHVHRIGELQRITRTGAFIQAGRGEGGQTGLADRILHGPGPEKQIDRDQGHLVPLDEPHGDPVGQLPLHDRRHLQGGWQARPGRRGPVGDPGSSRDHGQQGQQQGEKRLLHREASCSGITESSTRRSVGRKRRTAELTSSGAMAR